MMAMNNLVISNPQMAGTIYPDTDKIIRVWDNYYSVGIRGITNRINIDSTGCCYSARGRLPAGRADYVRTGQRWRQLGGSRQPGTVQKNSDRPAYEKRDGRTGN